ncbi:hypothetical protein BaRGS_00017044 [Batillaria attramentaria]|uniref:B box-type domain-containing protein n=1 Tax=Batillaria attramentaria TaxID=370345 RepID=A0ABD0KXA9_9CAEN
MENGKCPVHREQDLIFFCCECNQPVCRDCKLGEHEHHTAVNLNRVANEARERISDRVQKLHNSICVAKYQLQEAEENFKMFQESAQVARIELENRKQLLLKWAEESCDQSLASLKEIVSEGRQPQKEFIASRQKIMDDLSRQKQALEEVIRSQSDLEVIRDVHNTEEQDHVDVTALLEIGCRHRVNVDFRNLFDFYRRMEDIERFVGSPVLTEISKTYPGMVLLPEFTCSEGPDFCLLDVYPMEDDKLCVAHAEKDQGGAFEHYVSVYDLATRESVKKVKTAFQLQRIKIAERNVASVTICPVLLTSSSEPLSIETKTPRGMQWVHPEKTNREIYTLKETSNTGQYDVCDTSAAAKHTRLFQINAENPVALTADSTGEYFAVIQQPQGSTIFAAVTAQGEKPLPKPKVSFRKKTPQTMKPKRPSVALFKRSSSNRIALFQPQRVENFSPSDICFFTIMGREVLLVADEANDVICIVDFRQKAIRDGRVDQIDRLGFGCPLLSSPAAMAVDKQRVLWIGCRQGRILKCIPNKKYTHPGLSATSSNDPNSERIPPQTSANQTTTEDDGGVTTEVTPPASGADNDGTDGGSLQSVAELTSVVSAVNISA